MKKSIYTIILFAFIIGCNDETENNFPTSSTPLSSLLEDYYRIFTWENRIISLPGANDYYKVTAGDRDILEVQLNATIQRVGELKLTAKKNGSTTILIEDKFTGEKKRIRIDIVCPSLTLEIQPGIYKTIHPLSCEEEIIEKEIPSTYYLSLIGKYTAWLCWSKEEMEYVNLFDAPGYDLNMDSTPYCLSLIKYGCFNPDPEITNFYLISGNGMNIVESFYETANLPEDRNENNPYTILIRQDLGNNLFYEAEALIRFYEFPPLF